MQNNTGEPSSPFIYLFSEIVLVEMLCFKAEFMARNKEQQNKWMSLAFTLHRDTFYDNFHLISTHKPRQITLEHANNYEENVSIFEGDVEVYFENVI